MTTAASADADQLTSRIEGLEADIDTAWRTANEALALVTQLEGVVLRRDSLDGVRH